MEIKCSYQSLTPNIRRILHLEEHWKLSYVQAQKISNNKHGNHKLILGRMTSKPQNDQIN